MSTVAEKALRNTVFNLLTRVSKFNAARRKADGKPHPYLHGVHAPMARELTLFELPVTGQIPPQLDGRYVRIGPNPITPPNPATYHWFLGDGMVHGLKLGNGKAQWYRNRWIKTRAVSKALGQPEAPGPRNRGQEVVNTNVIGHAGAIWALVEAGTWPVRLDDTLETVAHDPFGQTLRGSYSAHPHRDPDTGEIHAICYEATRPDVIRHVVVDAQGKTRREEPISVANGPMIHDCAITKNYVVVLDLPVTLTLAGFLAGFGFPYKWRPKRRARIGLLPREGKDGDVIWCDVDPCFVFHPSNGFELPDGTVVLDVCAYRSMFADGQYQGPDTAEICFERWSVNPKTRRVIREIIDNNPQEFPRTDERLTGKPYRYAYSVAIAHDEQALLFAQTRLYKHDLERRTRQVHDFGENRHPGEFVFVPRTPDAAEDDGWLMGFVINSTTDTTDLVILNAQDFEGAPQAVVHLPHRIPPGFHGNWIASSQT